MSSWPTIAAVTEALRALLQASMDEAEGPIASARVTTLPPDRARADGAGNQLNVFLYHVVPDAAFRNEPLPPSHRIRQSEQPPLALDLRYLLTAYGLDDQDVLAHQVLGRAMAVLHDQPLLSRSLLGILSAEQPDNDAERQVERIRLSMIPLPLDDLSKLWTSFQSSGYRISAAYEASVVLIESERLASPTLPVLTRAVDDTGVFVLAGLPGPSLRRVVPDRGLPAMIVARLGDRLLVEGTNLAARHQISFSHPRLDDPIVLSPSGARGSDRLLVPLPPAGDPAAGDWLCGIYNVAVLDDRGPRNADGSPRWMASNAAPFALAPLIERSPATVTAAAPTLTVTCRPALHPDQLSVLVLPDRLVEPDGPPTTPEPGASAVTFDLSGLDLGDYMIRLRVDGLDSVPLAQPPDPDTPLAVAAGRDPQQVVHVA